GAIPAEQRHTLALVDLEADPVEDAREPPPRQGRGRRHQHAGPRPPTPFRLHVIRDVERDAIYLDVRAHTVPLYPQWNEPCVTPVQQGRNPPSRYCHHRDVPVRLGLDLIPEHGGADDGNQVIGRVEVDSPPPQGSRLEPLPDPDDRREEHPETQGGIH